MKTTKEFNRVYKNSKTVHTSQFVLFYQAHKEGYRVGVVASKKVGNAVHRNRAKRLLRSHLINHVNKLKIGQYILVAKPLLLNSNYQNIDKQFFNALRRVKALKQ
ncbi:ribonuclease P protein component [Sulfurovum sp. bin170]|uniref:ribonuclease P protein component n=1 Tax=Sulfurovum sp. bin170 TaxID=2695268 RepID=UPI0013DF22A1|nr:ribonuclease P protein component [Sulfurovum sp. bin170]